MEVASGKALKIHSLLHKKGKHGVQPWYLRLTLFDILPHVFSFKGFRFSGKQDASFVSHDRLVLIK